MPLPRFLIGFFWDLEFSRLDQKAHRDLIIARLAEYGTDLKVSLLPPGDRRSAGKKPPPGFQASPRPVAAVAEKTGGLVPKDPLTPAQRDFLEIQDFFRKEVAGMRP